MSWTYSFALLLSAIQATASEAGPAQPIDTFDYSSSWSPDGRRLAFVSRRDGNDEIYVMNVDGTGLKRLTNDPAVDQAPIWSPDGSRISFVSGRTGNSDLYVMNADGSNLVNLTRHPAGDGERHSWAPDMSEIAFFSRRDGRAQIYAIRPDGTGLRRISESEADDINPAWSPDGDWIAFDSDRAGQFDVYVMKTDGSETRRITTHPSMDLYPSWSPDGERLLFISFRDYDGEIYVVDAEGGNEQRVTRSRDWDFDPMFSPDGRLITFNSRRDGRRGIYIMEADGSNPRKLTNTETSTFVSQLKHGADHIPEIPGSASPLFLAGELRAIAERLLSEGSIARARRLAEMEVAAYPTFSSYSVLAKVRRHQGEEAPPPMDEFLNLARRDCPSAEALYGETIRQHPGWILFETSHLNLIARGLLAEGAAEQAACSLRLNVKAYPKSAPARHLLAEALLQLEDREEARQQYQELMRLNPDDSRAAAALRNLAGLNGGAAR